MPTRRNHGRVSKPTSKKTKSYPKPKAVPRQDSPNANNIKNRTLHHPAQTEWTWENMPDIIYQLKPEGKSNRNEEPPPILSYQIHDHDVRDLPILPDNISSTVEEFRVEAWMRLDRRIRLKDITDRIHPDFRLRENALQQRGVRFRQAFGLLAWDSGNKRSLKLEEKLLAKMRNLGLDPSSNSTRGITPGLINPKAGEEGGRVSLPVGWGPNKSFRTKKVQCLKAELLKETMVEVEPSKSRAELPKPKEPTPDPDPSGFEAYMRSIEESFPEDLVEDAESLEPMEYELDSQVSQFEETQSCDLVAQIKYTPEYIIADEDLPKSVKMTDLDLTKGVTQPEPELKLCYPLVNENLNSQSPFWSSSSVVSPRGFCSSTCFKEAPEQPYEVLEAMQPSFCSQNKPQTPSTDAFRFINPSDLDTVKQQTEMNGLDNMLNEYYSAERQLNEMSNFYSFTLW